MLVSESPGSVVSANPGDTQCPQRLKADTHIKREREHLFGNGTIIFQERGTQSREVCQVFPRKTLKICKPANRKVYKSTSYFAPDPSNTSRFPLSLTG